MTATHRVGFATFFLLAAMALTSAAETKDPVGPITVELADANFVSGVVIDSNLEKIVLQTLDGQCTIPRKDIKNMKTGTASPKAGDDELHIGKVATPSDDVDDEAEFKRAKSAAPKNELDPKTKNLLDVIRNGPQGQLADAQLKTAAKDAKPSISDKDWEKAFAQIDFGNYKKAAQLFKNVIASGVNDDINKADAMARQKLNLSLADVIVKCYVTDKCSVCGGRGVIQCNDCNGTGYMLLNINTPAPTNRAGQSEYSGSGPKHSNLEGAHPRVQVCLKCRGNGSAVCENCNGTGLAYNAPTSYEREAYSAYCVKLATERLYVSDANYGDTARETSLPFVQTGSRTTMNMVEVMQQAWLKDSADRVKADIIRLSRAEGFYKLALKADPGLIFHSNIDLTQQLIEIGLRRDNLYGELTERMRFKDFKGEE